MERLQITIREEQPADYEEVHRLVAASFLTQGHTAEADYLDALRLKPEFVPDLALVAVLENGEIIGQIAVSRTIVRYADSETEHLTVSPLSVLPKYFRRGTGTALLRECLNRACDLGYGAVFLWGDPGYYRRHGFVPASEYNIYHRQFLDKDVEFIMVYVLKKGIFDGRRGTIDIF